MNFRQDINGIRGLAVVAVVVFHFFPKVLPGGFAGVDVFFVISGYLMTSIIYRAIKEDRFSLMTFYEARAWRLIPAVLFLFAVLLGTAYFLLLPADFFQLGRHVIAALLFVSNFVFYGEAGYFDSASHTKLLLHTWSLATEWQFYVIYPILLIMIRRYLGLFWVRWVVFLLALASLAWSQWSALHMPANAYYLLPSRAWEMMAGGLVFLFPWSGALRMGRSLTALALMSILVSFIWIHSQYPWPSAWTLPTVIATCALLYVQQCQLLVYRLLVVSWLGKTSYSVYLWHWPICAYMHLYGKAEEPGWMLLGIALSLVGGAVSYYGVETRFHQPKDKRAVTLHGGTLPRVLFPTTFAIVMAAAIGVSQTRGMPARMGSEMEALSLITDVYSHFHYPQEIRHGICHSVAPQDRASQCLTSQSRQIFIWGDSYAASLYPGLQYMVDTKYRDFGISQMTDGNGPPFFNPDGKTDEGRILDVVNQERLQAVARVQPRTVVMSWMINGSNGVLDPTAAVQALKKTVEAIHKVSPQSQVVVIGPVPHWQGNLVSVVLKYWKEKRRVAPAYLNVELDMNIKAWDEALANQLPALGVRYISAYRVLCPGSEGCLVYLGQDVTNLTAVDWGHLTRNASIYLAQEVGAQIFD